MCEKLLKESEIEDYEILVVDDGSKDKTWNLIKENHERNSRVKGIKFSKNFGHHSAITACFDFSEGDFTIFMDSDLQAQPEDFPKLIKEFKNGFDVVWGVASEREDSFLVKLTAKYFYKFFNKVTGINTPRDIVFACFSKKVILSIREFREFKRYSHAIWSYVGYKNSIVKVRKEGRFTGEIKYSFTKRISLAIVSLIGFSKFPLRMVSIIGFVTSAFSIVLSIYMILKKLFLGIDTKGFAAIIVTISFFFGILFLILGIIGEYIGIMLDEVKNRPLYLTEEILK